MNVNLKGGGFIILAQVHISRGGVFFVCVCVVFFISQRQSPFQKAQL